MKVVATKRGYAGQLREPGDIFEYPMKAKQKMPSWMKKVAAVKAPAQAPADASPPAE